jgi:uncharacterized protein
MDSMMNNFLNFGHMNIHSIIKGKKSEFFDLCRQHKVDKLYAFGSSVTDHFDPAKSDIDLVVSLDLNDPIEYGEMLLILWDKLESFFKRKVDLLTDESIHNPYLRRSIELTRTLIYDRQGEKVLS